MNPQLTDFKAHIEKIKVQLKEDLKSIRTGRATPALIENLPVVTYNGSTTLALKEIATIATEGPAALIVAPFDPATVIDIEKSIQKSDTGLTAVLQGTRLIVKVPPLSQEQREKFAKLVGSRIEERRVAVRAERDDIRRKAKSDFEKKELTEDDRHRLEKEIDSITQKAMEDLQVIKEAKEQEILQV